jgi:geranylgeranyl pyrophosphate synthase
MADDPLDEWFLDRELKFWPNLPPELEQQNQPSNTHSGMARNISNLLSLYELVQDDLDWFAENLHSQMIQPLDHPLLSQVATHAFTAGGGGKKIRPAMILLMSRALAVTDSSSTMTASSSHEPLPNSLLLVHAQQRKLALAAEAAHTTTLLHDDVVDESATRRGAPAAHTVFGVKAAVLTGDALLAQIYMLLATLENTKVITAVSQTLSDLVRGEIMQLPINDNNNSSNNNNNKQRLHENDHRSLLQTYLKKCFYKTASLMANFCKSAALLGDYPDDLVDAAYRYGKHVGIAFQLQDDALDYTGNASVLGKPVHADLEAGLATGPVLFAANMFPDELQPMLARDFSEPGDADRALELVRRSGGVEQTKKLARVHAELAVQAALQLCDSDYRTALIQLAYMAVERDM